MSVAYEQEKDEIGGLALAPSDGTLARLRRNPLAVVSFSVLALLILFSIVFPFVSPYRYDRHTDDYLASPSPHHWLGTDDTGYDLMTQLCVGGRISLTVGLGVEAIVIFIGGTLGLLAGYYGKRVEQVVMRFTDMMFGFPDILLAIFIMAVLGPSLLNVFVALAVTGWPGMARLVRAQTISLTKQEFVEAARAIGLRDSRIILRHVLPNLLSPLIVAATVDIGGIIIAESTLSFLGLGVQAPMPSWGGMIDHARASGYWRSHPALLVWPAGCLSMTVLSLNFLGDALRDAIDPRSRR